MSLNDPVILNCLRHYFLILHFVIELLSMKTLTGDKPKDMYSPSSEKLTQAKFASSYSLYVCACVQFSGRNQSYLI